MAHLLILNLVFFIIPTCGAIAFAVIVLRILRSGEPPAPAYRPAARRGTRRLPGLTTSLARPSPAKGARAPW